MEKLFVRASKKPEHIYRATRRNLLNEQRLMKSRSLSSKHQRHEPSSSQRKQMKPALAKSSGHEALHVQQQRTESSQDSDEQRLPNSSYARAKQNEIAKVNNTDAEHSTLPAHQAVIPTIKYGKSH
jgi:hypothetical protein